MTERQETPLGLCRQLMAGDDQDARYLVATSVLTLPDAWLAQVVQHEVAHFGPLRPAHRFEWDKRDIRLPKLPKP